MHSGRFGEMLRELREERGVTQKQLAERVHVSRNSISRAERGAAVSTDLADTILKELGGVYVLGVGLTFEETKAVYLFIKTLRTRRKERGKKHEYFKRPIGSEEKHGHDQGDHPAGAPDAGKGVRHGSH